MSYNKFYPISMPSITEKEISLVHEAMKSGWVSSLGPFIDKFEKSFASFCGVKYALAASNGTTGLHLALEVLGIGKGDEVIIPDLTFVATANAIAYTQATPILVDIDPKTLCIDPNSILKAITKRTKAIMPVHLYGHPCDMDAINKIAKEHSLLVIEDAAEAHGSEYKGKKVGSLSDIGVFSFYGNKLITTGEGGMLTTNNLEFYERARFLRDHAMSKEKRYFHPEVGYNYRMTNIQAALGVAQLERINDIIAHRRDLYKWYSELICKSDVVSLNFVEDWAKSTYWLICLEVKGFTYKEREILMRNLKEAGIDTRPYFYPLSTMPMYSSINTPISIEKGNIGINLPTYFDLTYEDVAVIADLVNKNIEIMLTSEKQCEI